MEAAIFTAMASVSNTVNIRIRKHLMLFWTWICEVMFRSGYRLVL